MLIALFNYRLLRTLRVRISIKWLELIGHRMQPIILVGRLSDTGFLSVRTTTEEQVTTQLQLL